MGKCSRDRGQALQLLFPQADQLCPLAFDVIQQLGDGDGRMVGPLHQREEIVAGAGAAVLPDHVLQVGLVQGTDQQEAGGLRIRGKVLAELAEVLGVFKFGVKCAKAGHIRCLLVGIFGSAVVPLL